MKMPKQKNRYNNIKLSNFDIKKLNNSNFSQSAQFCSPHVSKLPIPVFEDDPNILQKDIKEYKKNISDPVSVYEMWKKYNNVIHSDSE